MPVVAQTRAREQLAEAAQVNQTVRQYLVELEQQNPTGEPQIGLRRLRLRRLQFVRERFFLAAVQNLKRLVRFLSQPTTPAMEAPAY